MPSKPPENASLAIQNVVVPSVAGTSATIEWETDKPGTSQVNICDPAGICIQSEPKEDLVTTHSITMANLKADTKYHYTVISKDAAGNEAKSEGDLTTLKQIDTTPPMISEIKPLSITESSAIITWVTDEAATSQVSYGKTSSYGTDMSDDKLITSHVITLTKLEPATTYHFTVKSTDASSNEAASQTDQTFTTLQPIPVGPNVGNRAPDFTLQTSDGNSVTLSTLRGKIVIVNFWATWCGPCVAEMPNFQEIYNETDTWPHDQLEILAIHVQQQGSITPQDYKQNNQLTFPVLLDTTGEIAAKYTPPPDQLGNHYDGIPKTFFIDKDGIIQKFQYGSFQDKQTIEDILNSLK